MTTTIRNLTGATRSAVCFAMAVLIVSAGLTAGAVGADVAYQSAVARSGSAVAVASSAAATRAAFG
jgi:hypothetical protein